MTDGCGVRHEGARHGAQLHGSHAACQCALHHLQQPRDMSGGALVVCRAPRSEILHRTVRRAHGQPSARRVSQRSAAVERQHVACGQRDRGGGFGRLPHARVQHVDVDCNRRNGRRRHRRCPQQPCLQSCGGGEAAQRAHGILQQVVTQRGCRGGGGAFNPRARPATLVARVAHVDVRHERRRRTGLQRSGAGVSGCGQRQLMGRV